MHPDRWRTVNDIFHAALERPAAERFEFVGTASNGDAELEAEVRRLLAADEQAEGYLETPIHSGDLFFGIGSSPFQIPPGSVLKNRFQIVRALGEGGMGSVFEALDLDLKVHVALKVIRPEIALNPATLSFFRREVRTARTITHPNVCRTYDFDHGTLTGAGEARGEFVFLTMELLEGETLAARLKRQGPLEMDAAIVIARQIASALDAAHAKGVVHRDIKPANIMLVPAGSGDKPEVRAVITDFGLALASAPTVSAALSSAGLAGAVGTLAYMAPEQLDPEGAVSASADIYAFGLVLFEMVSGRRAFPSSSLLSGIAQRLRGRPPSLRTLVPHLPPRWDAAIDRCLRVDPAERYATAAEVTDALEGKPAGQSARRRFTDAIRRMRRIGWSLAAAGVMVALLALFAVGARFYRSKTTSKVETGALIYLAPVRNETGEKAFDNLAELIRAGLSQSAQVRLVDPNRVGDILQQMTRTPDTAINQPTGREIAMRAGAVRAVFATVKGTRGSYRIEVDLQKPDNTPDRYRDHWTQSFAWHSSTAPAANGKIPPELLAALREASNWVRLAAGESQNDIARLDIPPEDVTTRSWEALDEFTRAMQLHSKADTEDAIPALEHAVALDKNFALALARLGDFQIELGRHEDGYLSYRRALAVDELERLTRRERDRIAGLAALDFFDFDAAETAFRDYVTLYPDDYLGWFYRGYPLMMLGRTEESLASLQRAHRLDPESASPEGQLAIFEAALGKPAEAQSAIQDLEQHHHPVPAAYARGILAFVERRYDDANAAFAQLQQSPEAFDKPWSLSLLARVAAERGEYDHAVELLTRGIELDAEQGNRASHAAKLLDRGYLACNLRRFADCFADLRNAEALDDSPETCDRARGILARVVDQSSNRLAAEFRAELAKPANCSPAQDFGQISKVAQARVRGDDLLARHQWAEAIDAFRRASALEPPASPRTYLARALVTAADHGADPRAARAMKREALELYSQLLQHPDMVWRRPIDFPPGFLADQTRAFLRLAFEMKEGGAARAQALELYNSLRPHDSEFPVATNQANPGNQAHRN